MTYFTKMCSFTPKIILSSLETLNLNNHPGSFLCGKIWGNQFFNLLQISSKTWTFLLFNFKDCDKPAIIVKLAYKFQMEDAMAFCFSSKFTGRRWFGLVSVLCLWSRSLLLEKATVGHNQWNQLLLLCREKERDRRCVCACVCVRVFGRVREWEREKERPFVRVCVCNRERDSVKERERASREGPVRWDRLFLCKTVWLVFL